jgi:hypothetical protein
MAHGLPEARSIVIKKRTNPMLSGLCDKSDRFGWQEFTE